MEKKKIIGYTTGVFDMFHIGHLNLLKKAKSQCDHLIVGVTTDKLCIEGKGVNPIISENERKEIVDSIKYVDETIFQNTYNKVDVYNKLKYDIIFVGDDWKGSPRWIELENKFNKLGVKIIYLKYTKGISSSKLRKKIQ